ncbi:photosystem I reaction centre subunit XI [Rubidibacter lacunae KORDI 51-2]|uniref:Photosystem I reaction center subunit XI n=1 Tax=Rubidibacter lacunae KORDI 51-2 TaxID=582515 RepID=U5DQ91_9CHRO|nr:photosystem I reaction center protein subunit XI [Rubidibacter lacunae]ERN42779.1 photosystem I reaction centre subunit XI [Rubidibacter lacunae KORDI 51-2]
MADSKSSEAITPYNDDIFAGHLSTPISDSAFVRSLINNLPAYRSGVSPLLRGLEVGMAHGYFAIGPWVLLGPLRDTDASANIGGLIAGIGLILVATIAMSAYGLVSFPKDQSKAAYFDDRAPEALQTGEGWSQFAGGFFVGAMGGAFVAYFLLENFDLLDNIMRGIVNS